MKMEAGSHNFFIHLIFTCTLCLLLANEFCILASAVTAETAVTIEYLYN